MEEDIKELQERLVQTCLDFIVEKNLQEVWGVEFNVYNLPDSVPSREWKSGTDSFIRLEAMGISKFQVNGKTISSLPMRVTLGENRKKL